MATFPATQPARSAAPKRVSQRKDWVTWRLKILAGQVLIAVVILAAWELADRSGRYGIWISAPSRIAVQLWEWFIAGSILPQLWASLQELFVGYLVGSVIGVGLGLAIGLTPRGGRAWDPLIRGFNAIPRFALAPLFIIWFGTGLEAKVVLIATAVGYIMLSTTLDGVRRVDQDLTISIRLMGASRMQVTRLVVIPAARSAMLLGARIAIPYGLVAVVAADMLVGTRGLGYLISRASGYLDMDQLFAAIVLVMGIGVVLNTVVGSRTRGMDTTGQVAGKSW